MLTASFYFLQFTVCMGVLCYLLSYLFKGEDLGDPVILLDNYELLKMEKWKNIC